MPDHLVVKFIVVVIVNPESITHRDLHTKNDMMSTKKNTQVECMKKEKGGDTCGASVGEKNKDDRWPQKDHQLLLTSGTAKTKSFEKLPSWPSGMLNTK